MMIIIVIILIVIIINNLFITIINNIILIITTDAHRTTAPPTPNGWLKKLAEGLANPNFFKKSRVSPKKLISYWIGGVYI